MGNKLTYEYIKNYIESFGYELISNEYVSAHSPIILKCQVGHEYQTTYGKFQSGRRCPECALLNSGAQRRLSYDFVKYQLP